MKSADIKRKTKALVHHAYANMATVVEAAAYAGITTTTLYKWFKEDPEFRLSCEMVKTQPVFKAKQTVVKNLNTPKNAQWLLERKAPEEFGNVVTKRIEGNVNFTHKLEEMSNEELMKIAYADAIEAEIIDGNATGKLDGEDSGGEKGVGETGTCEKEIERVR